MAIQRYRGSSMEDNSSQSFSSMLDRFFNESVNTRSNLPSFNPQVDTCETEEGYEIEVSLPGLKKDEVNIEFNDGRLTVSGERSFSDEKRDKKYHLIESQYGSFSRSFYLPDSINSEAIEANLEDGVLHISVPKDTRRSVKQKIQIKGSNSDKTENKPKSGKSPDAGSSQKSGEKSSKK